MKGFICVGIVLGALVMFFWMIFADTLLPWRCYATRSFQNAGTVVEMLSKEASIDGLYVYPNSCLKEPQNEKMHLVMSIKHGSALALWKQYTLAIIGYLVISLFIALGLSHLRTSSYVSKLGLISLFGLILALFIWLPEYIRFGMPISYLLMQIRDLVVAWIFAGAVIALFIPKKS